MTRRAALTAICILAHGPADAQPLADRLRGMSIEIRTSMSTIGVNRHGQYTAPTVRAIKLYVSTKGRLFDYTAAGYTDESGVDRLNSGSKIVAFGERWEAGKVGQQWDVAPGGLVRTRFYPWGQQEYRISIASDLRRCAVRGTMMSTRPDGKFFFYDSHDGQPNEVLSHGVDTGSCRITRGNVFAADQD
jgi:hypothetical protein